MVATVDNPDVARPSPRPLRIFVVAGEHSGTHLGAGLLRSLRALAPDAVFHGVGGREMVEEGLVPCFPVDDIAVMGVLPVLARLPRLLRRIDDAAKAALAFAPDVLVIIDSPDFTHRVARRVRQAAPAIPIVDYVSPTVWAWRPGRARAMRPYVDHLLALLPFEPAAHARLGGPPCTYVGHPLVERLDVLRRSDTEEGRPGEPPLLLVLPGSRRAEIKNLSPDFGGAIARVAAEFGPFDLVLPAVEHLVGEIAAQVASWPVAPRVVVGEREKFAAFRQARAALATSGTVTLELALAGVPMAVAYKVTWSEVWIRHVINVPSIVLPNLIAEGRAVPEFIQERCTPENLAAALIPLMRGGPERDAQVEAFAEVDRRMRLGEGESPSGRAAALVLSHARAPAPSTHVSRA